MLPLGIVRRALPLILSHRSPPPRPAPPCPAPTHEGGPTYAPSTRRSRCEQPLHVAVHGRGFVVPGAVQCRLGGDEVVDATWYDNYTIVCDPSAAGAPAVSDPAQGAVAGVEVTIDGGARWTRLTSASEAQVRDPPPAIPPAPPPPTAAHASHRAGAHPNRIASGPGAR